MNPAITILTYNDLLEMAKGTVEFFKNLKGEEQRSPCETPNAKGEKIPR